MVDLIYWDFSKIFDIVTHKELLVKLEKIELVQALKVGKELAEGGWQ